MGDWLQQSKIFLLFEMVRGHGGMLSTWYVCTCNGASESCMQTYIINFYYNSIIICIVYE
jgi:hypothetical protein